MFAKNFSGAPPNWVPGRVVRVTGPLSYEIELQQGGTVHRHVDAVRRREAAVTLTSDREWNDEDQSTDDIQPSFPTPAVGSPPTSNPTPPAPPRRSTRVRRPPHRYSQ